MGEAKRRSEGITANSKDPERDEIVVVATIETIKRAWSDGAASEPRWLTSSPMITIDSPSYPWAARR